MKKKLLLIVIDALTPRVMLPAMEQGKLPNFSQLQEQGELDTESVAIFPSITHAALTSLATGHYPNKSGIPGSYWLEESDNQIVHYIDDMRAIFERGVGNFFKDLMVYMNRDRVQQSTIFEVVERAGLRAACINHLIHRGIHEHPVHIPWLASAVPGSQEIDCINGPSALYIGDFVRTPLTSALSSKDVSADSQEQEQPYDDTLPAAGLMRRYGLDDQFSSEALLHLARVDNLPDFTLVYFMDNDYESHKNGPERALDVLEKIDTTLGHLFKLYGGVEKLLDEYCVMVTGDHSQSDISADGAEASICLDDLLADFAIAPIGCGWNDGDELVICPNMRTTQIYVKQLEQATIKKITDGLLADSRVDQVMWRGSSLTSSLEDHRYHVVTADRGHLQFWPAGPTDEGASDAFGGQWCWEGDLAAVDATVRDGTLHFSDYPNAFERIATILHAPNGGHVWATSRVGSEFQLQNSTVHTGGGSHASLHALDSQVPLLLAGAPEGMTLPPKTRTVDVMPLALQILGVDSPVQLSASRIPG